MRLRKQLGLEDERAFAALRAWLEGGRVGPRPDSTYVRQTNIARAYILDRETPMPGQPFTITIDDAQVQAALARLAQRAQNALPAMQDIGRALENMTEDAVAAEGPGWPALTPDYVRRRGSAHPILQRDGQLAASLHHTATADRATVGVSRIYAAIHQFGGTPDMPPGPRAVPARPYLPIERDGQLTPAARNEVLTILLRYLDPAT